jgi:hypothetical protein
LSSKLILTKKQAISIVCVVLAISLAIRLPQLSHPLAHHYESITALQLIAMESWKQAGGPDKFYGMPPVNYQQPGDKQLPGHNNIDADGNEVYISYGTAWNLTPYYFFSWLHIPPTPTNLHLLNICIGFLSCLMVFKLVLLISADSTSKYTSAAIASILFMLAPANLWYFGNVYVNCGFAIPLMLVFIYWVIKMILQSVTIRLPGLITLFLTTLSLFLTDWIASFIAAISVILILFHIKKNRKLLFPMLTIIAGIFCGVAIFTWQVFSLLGGKTAMNNLSGKFLFRTARISGSAFSTIEEISLHFITAFLPLIAFLVLMRVIANARRLQAKMNSPSRLFYQLLLPALILYNLVFLSWTKVHEFSILYYGVVFAIATGCLLSALINKKAIGITMLVYTTICFTEFYLINPPGAKGFNNEPYNAYKKLGLTIAEKTRNDQVIFSNTPLTPNVSYYAKRLVTYSNSLDEAKQQLSRFESDQAVWIEVINSEITGIFYFRK